MERETVVQGDVGTGRGIRRGRQGEGDRKTGSVRQGERDKERDIDRERETGRGKQGEGDRDTGEVRQGA